MVKLGIEVPHLTGLTKDFDHTLYEAIEGRISAGAHSEYNALIGKIVSFANSYRP